MTRIRLTLPDGRRLACRALLFDMDGVLVDSMDLIERHLRKWAGLHGLDAEAVLEASPGRTNADLVALFTPDLDLRSETERLTRQEVTDTDGVRACPGTPELLDRLPKDAWAVVTSGDRPVAHARLGAAGLPIPDVLVTAGDVLAGKPDPQGYRDAARRLDVLADDCIVLEDAPAGVAAARAAGMRSIEIRAAGATGPVANGDFVVADVGCLVVDVFDDERFADGEA